MTPAERLPVDGWLVGLALLLLLAGCVAIASASVEYAATQFGDAWHHSRRHGFYLLLALAFAALVYRVPPTVWQRTDWLSLVVAAVLLALVLVPGVGHDVNGSQRWLRVAGFSLQPSEFAKGATILYTAGYLVRHGDAVRTGWRGFLRPSVVLVLLAGLLLLEPDFGATVIIVGTAFGMLFLAGMRLLHFVLLSMLSALGLSLLALAAPYRLQRLVAYTDPWADPFGAGFQLIQSLIAFGRGEWFGVGLGNSVQKLFYLPEAHTDFVFSIWAEETGFIGSLALIAVFLALVLRLFWLGRRCQLLGDDFAGHVCHGVAIMFSGQALVNMGVSSGLLPTKGLTLPLVSYGGSSLLVCCALLAIVLRIDAELRGSQAAPASRGRRKPDAAAEVVA